MMTLSEQIVFKMVSFLLCDNIYCKLIIFAMLFLDIKKKKSILVLKKQVREMAVGIFLILLNSIINLDFIYINFVVLGIGSTFFNRVKFEKYVDFYLIVMIFKGVIFLCSTL